MKVKSVSRKVYVANDGKKFESEADCLAYEAHLERENDFIAFKKKVDEIECIENTHAPFGSGYVDEDKYEYRWYRPKSYEEVITLNTFFNTEVEQGETIADVIGEWVGIEIDGGYENYTGQEDVYCLDTISKSTECLIEFYASLGYDVKIQKRDDTVKIRDDALKDLWKLLETIPRDNSAGCIEQPFLHFAKGTGLDKIFSWFSARYSGGIRGLMRNTQE